MTGEEGRLHERHRELVRRDLKSYAIRQSKEVPVQRDHVGIQVDPTTRFAAICLR